MTAMLRSLRRSEFLLPPAITARVKIAKSMLGDVLAFGSIVLGFAMTIAWIACLGWLATHAIAALV